MKKTLLLLCLLLTSILAMAYDAEIDGIYYNLSGVNATVTYKTESCNSYSGNVVIPSTVTYKGITYSVTSIGEEAFYCCTGLTSVTIPNSVTSIGDDAFDYCTGLSSITIPNSVASIGNYAFEDCSGLTSVTIPESVTSIGSGAFDGCEGLTSITIPNSVTSIGSSAFEGCEGLISIVVESGNTMYDSRDNCNAIIETATNTLIVGCQNTIIPNSVTSIGNYAFARCTSLTSVTIGNSVTSIGRRAFAWCPGLTSVTIPGSVTSIGDYAFDECTGLTSVTIPESVTSIGYGAFEDCYFKYNSFVNNSALSSDNTWWATLCDEETVDGLLIRENIVVKCRPWATLVAIPNSVTSIGEKVFEDCSSLTSIVVESGNTMYDSRDNCNAIIETATNTLIAGCQNTIIPNSVTSIGILAFYRCPGLTSVTIPSSVTSIGDRSFEDYTGLPSVTIPNSVTSIGNEAFNGCTGLASVTIPNSVTSIGHGAFGWCTGLTSITIGNGVTSIGERAFSRCTSLSDVYCFATTIPSADYSSFDDFDLSSATLHVPAESLEAYQATAPWSSFGSIVPLTEEETAIENVNENDKLNFNTNSTLYDLNGRKVNANSQLKRGIYVICQSDGTTKRVLVK